MWETTANKSVCPRLVCHSDVAVAKLEALLRVIALFFFFPLSMARSKRSGIIAAQAALSYDSVGHCAGRCSGTGTHHPMRKLLGETASAVMSVLYTETKKAGQEVTRPEWKKVSR